MPIIDESGFYPGLEPPEEPKDHGDEGRAKASKGVTLYIILITLAFLVMAAVNTQDDGRTFFTAKSFSANIVGSGPTSVANYDLAANAQGTGNIITEWPAGAITETVYEDDYVFYKFGGLITTGGAGDDIFAKVSGTDTTTGFLLDKTTAGNNMQLDRVGGGGDEDLQFTAIPSGSNMWLQYNDTNVFGAEDALKYDDSNDQLLIGSPASTEVNLNLIVNGDASVVEDSFAGETVHIGSSGISALGVSLGIGYWYNGGGESFSVYYPDLAPGIDAGMTWPTDAPAVGEALVVDTIAGNVAITEWQAVSASPAGADTYIQWNLAGVFGAEAAFWYDDSNDSVGIGLGTSSAAGKSLELAGSLSVLANGATITGNTTVTGGGTYTGEFRTGGVGDQGAYDLQGAEGIVTGDFTTGDDVLAGDDVQCDQIGYIDNDGAGGDGQVNHNAADISGDVTYRWPDGLSVGDNLYLASEAVGVFTIGGQAPPAERVYVAFASPTIPVDTFATMDGLVLCTASIGWIPMRNCSITGMSVQVGVPLSGIGASWDIEVYVNGGQVWFDTLSTAGDTQVAFQTQADGTDSVTAGQNVSVNFDLTGGPDMLEEPHVLIEITYD